MGLIFEIVLYYLDNLKVFLLEGFAALFLSYLFSIFLVPLDLPKHGFRMEGIAKTLKSRFLLQEMLREQLVMIFLKF